MDNIYYVYGYIDPRNYELFYIGKGKGRRYKEHYYNVLNDSKSHDTNIRKKERIKEIIASGSAPIYYFFDKNISNSQSIELEKFLIEEIKRIEDGGPLLNKWIGYKIDPESKNQISEALKRYYRNGGVSPMKGRRTSPEAKIKQSESRKRLMDTGYRVHNSLNIITPHGIFKSTEDPLALAFGLTKKMLSKRCLIFVDKKITKQAAIQIKDFDASLFIGKTWREIGWYSESVYSPSVSRDAVEP